MTHHNTNTQSTDGMVRAPESEPPEDWGHKDCEVCDEARRLARVAGCLDDLEARIMKLPPERRSGAMRTLQILRRELTEAV